MKYTVFETKMGWVGLLASEKGLVRTTLPRVSKEGAISELILNRSRAAFSPDFFKDLTRIFVRYFNGEEVSFPAEIDLSSGTPFQQSVWRITSLIPYGEVRSYRWVAEGLGDGRMARATGQALGKNPLPLVIPCHRVIGSDGGLCGFGGGLNLKKRLLRLEKVAGIGRSE